MNEFKWFLVALIALWVLWAAAGGYTNDASSKDKPLLHQPSPIENGQPYTVQDLKNQGR